MKVGARSVEEVLLLRRCEEMYEHIKGQTPFANVLTFAQLMEEWLTEYSGLMKRLPVDETLNFNSLENFYLKNFPHSEGGPVLQAFRRKGKKYGTVEVPYAESSGR